MVPGLLEGWKFASPQEGRALIPDPQFAPVRLTESFRFDCKGVGECCWHWAKRTCQHVHRVGQIDWRLREGRWQCPFWNEGNRQCNIYEERPLVCRLYPLGVSVFREARRVVVWKFATPTRCLPCHTGPKHTVAGWLADNGFWEVIEQVCDGRVKI